MPHYLPMNFMTKITGTPGTSSHLEETNDGDLIVSHQGLGCGDLGEGGSGGAGALLQPVDDVVSSAASCCRRGQ